MKKFSYGPAIKTGAPIEQPTTLIAAAQRAMELQHAWIALRDATDDILANRAEPCELLTRAGQHASCYKPRPNVQQIATMALLTTAEAVRVIINARTNFRYDRSLSAEFGKPHVERD